MRKCKYIGQESSYLFTIGEYYYYEIIKYKNNNTKYEMPFPYHIYNTSNITKVIGTFSKDYFDVLFFDIEKERKEKLKKLNEKF